jgi:lysophospholipase L1-like esterase
MGPRVASPKTPEKRIPLRRRLLYALFVYLLFLLTLVAVEVITRLSFQHIASLDIFVSTSQQRMQVADEKQSSIFEGDPLLLWRLKPNLDHAVWDFTVLSTNPQGFRADYAVGPKSPGTFRIICLGDSVTFGYRVPVVWPDKPTQYDPEWLPYPMLLEKHLRDANPRRRIEVITMAVPGYTSHQGLAWLRHDINWLQPDIVVASFGWNDASLSDAPDRMTIRTNWYAVATRWLINNSQAFAHVTHWLRSRTSQPTSPKPRPVSRVSQAEYIENFGSIVDLCTRNHAQIIVMGAPYRDNTTNPSEAVLMTSYRSALRSNMESRHIPYMEVLELTEAAGSVNQGFFGELIHPNHMGHRLIASALVKLMIKERLLGELNLPEFAL